MQPVDLYGRDAEMAWLDGLLGDRRPIALVGEAGIGKTALVRAAAARAGLDLREGGGLETLAWVPLLALRRAVGDGLRGDATEVAIEAERRVGPRLLFIDDLQWTDDPTRHALALLAGRVALVVSIRATDPAAPAARALVEAMGAEVIELVGLDPAAALAIVRRVRPSIDPAAAAALVEQAGGNPLLLEELASRGRPTSSLARALSIRLDRLTAAGRRSFALLALAGHGMAGDALGSGAAELVTSGVATSDGALLVPRHALLAEAMVRTLGPEIARRCHLRLARIVADQGERAHHLAAAGRAAEAIAAARGAAREATTLSERAALLELVARLSSGPDAARPRIEAARLLVVSGGSASARAIEILEPILAGPLELLLERDVLLAKASYDTGDLVASRAAYERARLRDTELAPGIAAAVSVRARLDSDAAAFAMNVDGDLAAARRILGSAIEHGRGAPRVIVTHETLRAFIEGDDTFDAVRTAYEALIADPETPDAAFAAAHNAAYLAMIARGVEPAHAFLVRAAADFEAREMAGRADELRSEDTQVLLFGGRLGEGLRLADELLERPLNTRSRQWTEIKRAQILAALGRADESAAAVDAVVATVTGDYQGRGELYAARVEIEAWAGRPQQALEAYEAHIGIPSPSPATEILPLLGAQWARYELGLDPGPVVAHQPWAIFAGAALESEGIRALYAGLPAVAADRFADAAARWRGFHIPREMICRWAHGESLRLAGSGQAIGALRDALTQVQDLGFGALAVQARRSLRQAGEFVAPPRPETPAQRAQGMTSREREALQLVGRGMTSTEIARRMGLGRGTVDQVLGAATRRLGAVSRVQAAAILAEDVGGRHGRGGVRRVGPVRTEADAHAAVLAALEGADVTLDPAVDPELAERVQDDLRRIGRTEAPARDGGTPAATLDGEERRVLDLLAEGLSLGEVAASMHLSRRTADRRLASARRALGAATTAEALVAFRRSWRAPLD